MITTGSIAQLAFVFGDYMSRLVPLGPYSSAIHAALNVLLLTLLNIAGLNCRAQDVFVDAERDGCLAGTRDGGGDRRRPDRSPPPSAAVAAATTNPPALPAFATALLFVLFTFGGWSEAAYLSAEVKGGRRSIVKVLVLALLLVTLIYLLFVFSLLRGLGFDGLKASQAVAADVAGRSFGVFGEKLIGAIAALAALTSINATLPVSARTSYSLGKDWRIFAFMNRWSGERDAPIAALIVTGVLSLALVVVAAVNQSGVKFMVEFTAPVFWFFFLLTGLALFVLRFRQPQLARPFKVPMYPILPFVFVLTSAFLLYRSLEWALINRAVQLALYGMAAGVVAWIVARLHAHFDRRIPNRPSRME